MAVWWLTCAGRAQASGSSAACVFGARCGASLGAPRWAEPPQLGGMVNAEAQTTDSVLARLSTQIVQAEYFEMSVDVSDIFDIEYAVSAMVDLGKYRVWRGSVRCFVLALKWCQIRTQFCRWI